MNMPLEPTWPDIAIRLVLTMLACGVIGLNRGARGPEDLPKLVKEMKYRALQEQRQPPEPEKMDYTFELSWRRPELADPPLELLRQIDQSYPVNHSSSPRTTAASARLSGLQTQRRTVRGHRCPIGDVMVRRPRRRQSPSPVHRY